MREAKEPSPRASRPHMPGYRILAEVEGRGLLPWTWAAERLAASHNYWVCTSGGGGRPHAMPVWGLWLEGVFLFSTGGDSRKARNLAENPLCSICTERADEAVVLEGNAAETRDADLLQKFVAAYKLKYDWDMDPNEGGIYAVQPRVAFGFIEAASEFGGSATRWKFHPTS